MWSVKAVEEKLQGKKVIRIWRERERERERMVGEREREDMKGEESRRITDPQNNKNKTASHLQSAHSRTNLCSSLDPMSPFHMLPCCSFSFSFPSFLICGLCWYEQWSTSLFLFVSLFSFFSPTSNSLHHFTGYPSCNFQSIINNYGLTW